MGINANADEAHFVRASYPWFLRGGYYPRGLYAGVFAFSTTYGQVDVTVSFRVVLHTIFKKSSKIIKKNEEK